MRCSLETTAGGFGKRAGLPLRSMTGNRADSGLIRRKRSARSAEQSFNRFLAAAGVPPGLFAAGADGTSHEGVA